MCNHCYHAYGRTKLATLCPHKDRLVYAKSMCISCYQKRKRAIRNQKLNENKWLKDINTQQPIADDNIKDNSEDEQSFVDFLKKSDAPEIKKME